MSRVQGAARAGRMLKRLPDAMRAEMVKEMTAAGPAILARSRGETPVRTGLLRSLLSFKVYAKSLRLRVGLIGASANKRGWYGRILERGRKAQVVTFNRRSEGGSLLVRGRRVGTLIHLKVKAISRSRYDIVEGRTKAFAKRVIGPKLIDIYERALRVAANG